jgi:putative ABC transport system permease protein
VAIRIARRDARRYKWRSALIVAMVGLPVLFLTGGITLLATNDVSLAESVPMVMGSAQARIHVADPFRQNQSPDGGPSGSSSDGSSNEGVAALAVPGFAPNSLWTTGKVAKVTGGRVITMLESNIRVTQGDRRPTIPVLGIDARDPIARGMTDLVSGRWASIASEIVVTEAGIGRGLPRKGTVTTSGPDGSQRQLTVVGVATAQTTYGQLPSLVGTPALVGGLVDQANVSAAYLVERAEPVTWSDVRRMNDFGVLVKSRQVFLSPPSDIELGPGAAQLGSDQRQLDLVLLLAVVGIFIETTLLAGPAFAVSAARQRRSLALAASNGAEARQLRRYVLGQAVVLGVVSAAIAVAAGVLLALAGLTWWKSGHPDLVTGPFEVSWLRVVGVFVFSVVASMVAALLPARGVARLDIVSVLAGRSGDRKAHRGLPVVGVVVMVGSAAGILWSVAGADTSLGLGSDEFLVAAWAVGLVVGCLMVIPALLAMVGRLGVPLVLPLRLATRDTARQRGRSTPAVAAIMAAVAALTALSIGATSDTQQQEKAYQRQRPMGTGSITLNGEDSSERGVREVLARFAPQLRVDRRGYVGPGAANAEKDRISWVLPVPPGCTQAQVAAVERPNGGLAGCEPFANGTVMMQVGDLASISAMVPLTVPQRAALQGGGVLIANPRFAQDGQVSFVGGKVVEAPSGEVTGHEVTQRTRAEAVLVDPKVLEVASGAPSSSVVWLLADTATRLGWPVQITSFTLTSPTGAISPEVESAVADRLGDGYLMDVEHGFQNPYRVMLLILFSVAGILVLIASLVSTALSLAESQNDMATLAAVGATRRTRRGIAGSQALVVAACGCLLGVAVGMVPGIAVAWPLTTRVLNMATGLVVTAPPMIVIPWLPLAALCVGVPLLAGGFAWVAVRRHPQLTRRLA